MPTEKRRTYRSRIRNTSSAPVQSSLSANKGQCDWNREREGHKAQDEAGGMGTSQVSSGLLSWGEERRLDPRDKGKLSQAFRRG